jgi:hypothetical protein
MKGFLSGRWKLIKSLKNTRQDLLLKNSNIKKV